MPLSPPRLSPGPASRPARAPRTRIIAEAPELADCALRADAVTALVISGERAIVRHHVNAIAACGLDLLP